VSIFKYHIPYPTLADKKVRVEADTHVPTVLAIVTAYGILDTLTPSSLAWNSEKPRQNLLGGRGSILALASSLLNIMGEAMDMATNMFLLKNTTPTRGKTCLPHHMWDTSIKHDVAAIR